MHCWRSDFNTGWEIHFSTTFSIGTAILILNANDLFLGSSYTCAMTSDLLDVNTCRLAWFEPMTSGTIFLSEVASMNFNHKKDFSTQLHYGIPVLSRVPQMAKARGMCTT